MISKTKKTVDEKGAQKEDAVTAKVFLSGPIPCVDGLAASLTISPIILKAAGIYPQSEVELVATKSGILIKKTGNALTNYVNLMKASKLNPVVEALMEDEKFQQRLKNKQLSDEELDALDQDEAAAQEEERKSEQEATWSGPN